MSYMFMLAECFRCGKMFGSNPDKVPSMKDKQGTKQPLCAECVRFIQGFQREKGLPVWADPLDGAYEPVNLDGDVETGVDYNDYV